MQDPSFVAAAALRPCCPRPHVRNVLGTVVSWANPVLSSWRDLAALQEFPYNSAQARLRRTTITCAWKGRQGVMFLIRGYLWNGHMTPTRNNARRDLCLQ